LETKKNVYDLLEVIGEGTFSVVHRAKRRASRDGSPERECAVKRLKDSPDGARVRDEAKCLLCLDNEHVVKIQDAFRKHSEKKELDRIQ